MVSEWMANDNVVEYVRANAGNRLKLAGFGHVAHFHHPATPFGSRTPLEDFTTPGLCTGTAWI